MDAQTPQCVLKKMCNSYWIEVFLHQASRVETSLFSFPLFDLLMKQQPNIQSSHCKPTNMWNQNLYPLFSLSLSLCSLFNHASNLIFCHCDLMAHHSVLVPTVQFSTPTMQNCLFFSPSVHYPSFLTLKKKASTSAPPKVKAVEDIRCESIVACYDSI